jgi:hypothetical protein
MNAITPLPIPCLPATDADICAWIGQATPGEWLEYHRGFLGVDTSEEVSSLPLPDRVRLRALAAAARRAFEMRLVHLVQVRLGPDRFAYVAIARSRPRHAPASLARIAAERLAA